MEKAFLQYLKSLSHSGIAGLSSGDSEVARQLEQSVKATQEFIKNELRPSQAADEERPNAQQSQEPSSIVADPPKSQQISTAEPESQRTENQPSFKAPATPTESRVEPAQDLPNIERLNILNDRVKNCFACSELVSNRTQTVFGVGNVESRLCFMGEAPGADEDVQGEPFVGAAGQLLNRIIAACKMQREDVYILNTLKCRPPNNRNPTDGECANCRPFLNEQLDIIKPEFICCLGGIAAKHLLDTPLSVGRLRGKLHLYNGIKVVVTYHPAYLLRNPDAKRQVWTDMKFLMAEMGHDIT